jgi:glycosyltransferase involved in cell wall biosynthesis
VEMRLSREVSNLQNDEAGAAPQLAAARTAAGTLKTIVYFDHTALMSGGEIALLHLIRHLDTERYRPVVVLSEDGPLHAKLVEAGVETHILLLDESVGDTRKDSLGLRSLLKPRAILSVLRYAWRLARFLKVRKAELLHTNSLKSDVIGGIAGRLAHVPVIWHLRDRIATDYLPAPAVTGFRWLARLLPNCILTNSYATLLALEPRADRSRAIVKAGRLWTTLVVVHDGIPAIDADISAPSVSAPLIGLVGRLSPWKGQHIFLEAAAIVHSQFPEARFQIIGSAMFGEEEYEAKVRALCETLGLSDCVEFTGFRKDVPALIGKLDVLVHASTIGEPFGQVVVEGMIAGKPVVATNGGGVPEIVQDGVTGWLAPMGESAPMAEAILRLLRDPECAARMGAAGRQRVLDHFTIDLTARRVEAVYAQMLA